MSERRSLAGASLTSILIFRVVLSEPAETEKCSVFPQFTLRIRSARPHPPGGDTLQVSRRRHYINRGDNFQLLRKPRHPDGSKMEFDAFRGSFCFWVSTVGFILNVRCSWCFYTLWIWWIMLMLLSDGLRWCDKYQNRREGNLFIVWNLFRKVDEKNVNF